MKKIFGGCWLRILVACVLLAGCGLRQHGAQPDTVSHEVVHQDAGTQEPQSVASSEPAKVPAVKLISYRGDGPPAFRLLYPENWPVSRTTTGENVQIAKDGVIIMVSTYALQAAAPQTIEAMRQEMKDWAKGEPEIKQLSVPGTVSAFELKYVNKSSEVPETILQVRLYGSAFKQALMFRTPSELFAQWEPTFRQMIKSFDHSELDKNPLSITPQR